MDQEIYINQLPLDEGSIIIIESKWFKNEILLNILDIYKNEGFSGTLTIEEIKSFAENLEIEFQQFLDETKKILCTENGLSEFVYELKDNKFSWKRIKNLKITYGIVNLRSKLNLKDKMLLKSIEIITQLRKELNNQTKDFLVFQESHEKYVSRYEKCVAAKVNNETEMLTKFLALLNSKKEKISELNKLLTVTKRKYPDSLPPKKIVSSPDSVNILNKQENQTHFSPDSNQDNTPPITFKNIPKRKKSIQQPNIQSDIKIIASSSKQVTIPDSEELLDNCVLSEVDDEKVDKFEIDTQNLFDDF